MKNKKEAVSSALVLQERIEKKIFLIRGKKVMLDKDLALLYEVTTGNLNKAVSRNLDRFLDDFMFRLNKEEFKNLIFHSGTSGWVELATKMSLRGVPNVPKAFGRTTWQSHSSFSDLIGESNRGTIFCALNNRRYCSTTFCLFLLRFYAILSIVALK